MINTQRGEARNSFLAGNDGDGVLSSRFQRQPRDVPSLLNGEKEKKEKNG